MSLTLALALALALALTLSLALAPLTLQMLKKEQLGCSLALKDLQNEIAIMAQLVHPGVLRVRGVGEIEGRPFLVLERLATVLAAVLPKPVDQAQASDSSLSRPG